MAQVVTIFGGSGFIGRYIARRMANEGWHVRIAVRNVGGAGFLKSDTTDGLIEPIACNIHDSGSIASAIKDAVAVVNCVGVLDEVGENTFQAVQADAPGRIAHIASESGVKRMVHISSIGANTASASAYSRTKAAGEAAVLAHMPDAVILRPSIVFGPEDQFFNRFASMARLGPTLPVVGAETRFQPVYVDDVALAAVKGILGEAQGGIYELGGPDIETFRALMQRMLKVIERRRLVLNMPVSIAKLMAFGFAVANKVSFGLIPRALTADQIKNLAVDNVVGSDAKTLEDLRIQATSMDLILPDYL